jgi:integrase
MLTVKGIAALDRDGLYACGGATGLYVQVRGSRKTFAFKFQLRGTRRLMGLGSEIGLLDARLKAVELQRLVRAGIDPIGQRVETAYRAASSHTFAACAKLYHDAHRAEWSDSHARWWWSSMERQVFPALGELPVDQVDTGAVLSMLQSIWTMKTAPRVRGNIEEVLGYATAVGYRSGDNPARWRGHLKNLLSNAFAEDEHHAAIAYQDAPVVCAGLRALTSSAAQCLELLILAGLRASEARLLEWGEVDLASRTITVRAERMKGGRPHRVAITDRMHEILTARPSGSLVFADVGRDAVSDLNKTLTGATVHGWRTTFRQWLSDHGRISFEACELALAHQVAVTKAQRAYLRDADQLESRRGAQAAWERHLAAQSAEILRLHG